MVNNTFDMTGAYTMSRNMTSIFEKEKNIKAGTYTLVAIVVLFLMFFLISWTIPKIEEPLLDEGIEVNLGNSETGFGDIPPTVPGDPAPEQASQTASTPPSSPPVQEQVTTEDDNDEPDAPVIAKKVAVNTPKPKPVVNQNPPTPKATQQPPSPPQPKPKATMGAYSGGTGTGGNSQDQFNNVKNQGIAGGTGDQGKANGNINSDNYTGNGGTGKSGVSISRGLTGRRITGFPSFEDDFNENAKIAVDIKVNEDGRVISASYQTRGSTSGSANLKAIALQKAKLLKFNAGDESIGTVIFNFRLKG
jgi:outer membrane biosynthesis protein TonB